MSVQNANYTVLALDHTGGAKVLASIDGLFPIHEDSDSLTWIQCNKNDQTPQFLANLKMIPNGVIDVLCAGETRPRSLTLADAFVGVFRTVSAEAESSSKDDTTSFRIFINKNLIVTIQECPLLGMDRIKQSLQANIGPKTAAECLRSVLDAISDRVAEVITSWDTALDELENSNAATASSQATLTQLQKRIVTLRRYLIPQREAFSRIETKHLSWFDAESQDNLREISESMIRLVEDLEAEKERAELVQGTISAQSQQDTNQRMYFLSVVAAIFLPITFATGLLGVNLAGIPFASMPWAFPAFCLTLTCIAGAAAIYLRRRRWF